MLEHPLLAFMWEIVYRLVDIIPPPRWAVEYDPLW